MRKLSLMLVAALLVVGMFAGCTAPSAQSSAPAQTSAAATKYSEGSTLPAEVNKVTFTLDSEKVKAEGYTIGFAQTVMDHPYRIDMVKKAQAKCDELGVKMIMMDGEGDAAKEVSNVESMIAQKVDAIIISTHAGVALTPALLQAAEAKIPIILIDGGKPFSNWEYVTWMSTDDWQLGQLAAEMLVKDIGGEGKVLMIEGSSGSSCQLGRKEGFLKVLDANPNVKLVAAQDGNWLRKNAIDITSNILQANPDLKAVYAHNDEMALGAIEAIEKAGKVPGKDIFVYSAGDYQANAFEAIKAGKLQLTQIYNNDGGYAVEAALAHLQGIEMPKKINLGTEQATKDTVDTRTPAY